MDMQNIRGFSRGQKHSKESMNNRLEAFSSWTPEMKKLNTSPFREAFLLVYIRGSGKYGYFTA
jgi:hypothetical protein